ncbi:MULTISPECIES: MFS transporter [Streptomyces]|uniref:MFS transporter n=1 Tax=Streptomyces parvulus TaxID=146923 RepID=A0A191VAM7_9ACTN|nr:MULTISPECIES: MFS transporter [Streptomyces]ANJ12079.1 MFS transporter [Streptomyces parvulus]MZD57580.1 MFS transporter [Streptomyces sp. SID5606]
MRMTRSDSAAVSALATASLLATLLQTLTVPILPELPSLLDASPTDVSWVVTSTLLTGAVTTPVSGRLGDLYGKRRVLLLTMTAVLVGTVVSACTSSLWPMVVGRALQGAAVGVIPLAYGLARDQLPPERIGGSITLMSATLGVGGAAGIPLVGVVAENFDWHLLFWGSAVLTLLCTILLAVTVPESPGRAPGRFDVAGTGGLIVGLTLLLLPIVNGARWGWGDARTVGCGATAVVVLLVWGWHQMRTQAPVVDLRVAARRPVLMANLATLSTGFAVFAMFFVFPQILQAPRSTGYGFGQSLVASGLALLPNGLVALLLTPLAARTITRHGPRTALILSAMLIVAGYGYVLLRRDGVADIIGASIAVGAGAGISGAAAAKLITDAVPVTETASANGVNALMRLMGSATGAALLAVILAHAALHAGPAPLPSESGLRTAFLVATGAAVVGMVCAALVPRSRSDSVVARGHRAPGKFGRAGARP